MKPHTEKIRDFICTTVAYGIIIAVYRDERRGLTPTQETTPTDEKQKFCEKVLHMDIQNEPWTDPLKTIVDRALIGSVALLLVATLVQTGVYFQGHAQYLVSPVFFLAALVLLVLLRNRRVSLDFKTMALALTLGVVSVAIAPASPTALTVGTMISIMATAVWLFTRPNITAIFFWLLTAICATSVHILFAANPESHPAKAIVVVAVGGGICFLMYSYAHTMRQQRLQNEALIQSQRELLNTVQTQQQVNDLAISAADLVVYEIDMTTGYAEVVAGKSSWPELWATKPFLNVLSDVLPPDDRQILEHAIANPGEIAEFLIRHPLTSKPVYWGQFSFTAPLERDGRFIQMGYRLKTDAMVRARKLAESAQQRAEATLQRLNNIAEGGRIGLFRHNLVDDTWECNDIYREFYGLPKDQFPEVTTALIDARFDPLTRNQQLKERLEARSGERQKSHERHLVLPDGTRKYLNTFAKAEYAGDKVVAMAGSAFDLTQERETQLQLTRTNTQLSELLERQRSMFAIIGHELRTPVASIEMLSKDAELSDRQKIEMVEDIAQGLLGVLEDLRTVIAPERIKESQAVNASPAVVVRRALTPLSGLLQETGISLHLELPEDEMQCRFNTQALRQLVTNLVKNAAVHSGGKNIWTSLTKLPTAEPNKRAQLRVEDDGKGIESSQVNKLFEAYARGDTDADGTGLGLFISSELAIALGGQIHYEQSSKGGAAFVVTMSVDNCDSNPTETAVGETQAENTTLLGKRILLAEDDKTLQLLTRKILSNAGAEVCVCNDGEEALAAYSSNTFDVVLTDIMMPKLNGYGLAKALREAGYTGPIIGATAAVVGSETDTLLAAGADTVMAKPISLKKLESAIASVETRVN